MDIDVHPTDELPFHQTPRPFHVPSTSDVHFNDGYWFATFDEERFLAVGMRVHPNMNVVDGFVSLATAGEQEALRFSRPLHPDYDTLALGPLRLAFPEPLRTVRLALDETAGLAFDLTFGCVTTPFMETPSRHLKSGHVLNDMVRYIQVGRVDGTLTRHGETVAVERWAGTRDHSWGIRSSMGPPTPHGGRTTDERYRRDRRRFRLWVPFVLDDHAGFFHLHEDGRGRVIDVEGRLHLPDGSTAEVVAVEHDLRYHPGTRYPAGGTVRVTSLDGTDTETKRRYELTPVGTPADVQGIGYHGGWHDHGSAGLYRGDAVTVEHDRYPSAVSPDATGPAHVPAEQRIGPVEFACRVTSDTGGTGMAQLEHSVLGAYDPYGFTSGSPRR